MMLCFKVLGKSGYLVMYNINLTLILFHFLWIFNNISHRKKEMFCYSSSLGNNLWAPCMNQHVQTRKSYWQKVFDNIYFLLMMNYQNSQNREMNTNTIT